MKTVIILTLLIASLIESVNAALPVTDAASISLQRLNAHRDYLEQLLQTENEIAQVKNLVHQIAQIDENLKRLGDPGAVSELAGSDFVASQLRQPEMNISINEIGNDGKSGELFAVAPPVGGVQISKEILVDGKPVGVRSASLYEADRVAFESLKHYQIVRKEVLTRRTAVKEQLANAVEQVKSATTMAEIAKLSAVVSALQAQLSSLDAEMNFAALEAQHIAEVNTVNSEIQRKASVETERASLKVSGKRDSQVYRLLSAPVSFNP